ncbi:MAG: heparinase II/III family protein [bacterium]|nr:heparinase II/III family protein [bacterium]
MKKSITVWLCGMTALGVAMSLVNSLHSEEAQPPKVAADTVLKSLREGHPRLVMLESDLERVRGLIQADSAAKRYSEELRTDAEQLLEAKPVEYVIIGPRLLSQSRRCLHRVYTLGLVYRLTGERRFADRAKKELMAAAAFPDWNPSHFLDTAEMCHAFAIGYDWLYDTFTPQERGIIKTAIVEKALKPALGVYEKNEWWARTVYNWNQVCNGGIGIGALAIADEEPELAARVLSYAIESIPLSMKTFGPDGAFPEGPGYWGYASQYAVFFFAALESALGRDFGLSAIPGFSDAGLFRIYFCGPIGRTFNFADAGEGSGSAPQMFWIARRFDKPIYAWHQRQSVRSPGPLDLVWFDPRGEGPVKNALPLGRHFKGVDVVFFRSKWEDRNAIFVGFKGGDNRVNHSHLDLGSFVLDALGERWAVDLGPDDYDLPGYFGSKRWTYYRLRTESHNTLVINDKNQSPDAPAPIIGFGSTPERGWAIADMTRAYPDVKGSVRRGMALLNRSHVLVQDEISSSEPVDVLWGMVTEAKVELQGKSALLSIGTGRLLARILEPGDASFEIISANPPRPQRQQPNAKKLAVRIPQAKGNVRIAVVLSPFQDSEPTPKFVPQLQPLDKWNR